MSTKAKYHQQLALANQAPKTLISGAVLPLSGPGLGTSSRARRAEQSHSPSDFFGLQGEITLLP